MNSLMHFGFIISTKRIKVYIPKNIVSRKVALILSDYYQLDTVSCNRALKQNRVSRLELIVTEQAQMNRYTVVNR